jgi:tetratricopeptide (TPR) repeat protein
VAAGLLLAFFITLFGAAALLRPGLARAPALVLATCFALTAYFAVHLNFDWLEEIPAIASPALGLPLVALVVATRAAGGPRTPSRRRHVAAWAAGGLAVVALVSLVPPYLSVRYSNRAEERAGSDLAGAFSDLDRARSLNPVALGPDLAEGRIAIDSRRYDRAREAFERSLTVEDNWLAHFELALLDAGAGRFGSAAQELARARSLNSRDPVLTRLRRNIAARRTVDPKRENTRIQRAAQARFTTSGR